MSAMSSVTSPTSVTMLLSSLTMFLFLRRFSQFSHRSSIPPWIGHWSMFEILPTSPHLSPLPSMVAVKTPTTTRGSWSKDTMPRSGDHPSLSRTTPSDTGDGDKEREARLHYHNQAKLVLFISLCYSVCSSFSHVNVEPLYLDQI